MSLPWSPCLHHPSSPAAWHRQPSEPSLRPRSRQLPTAVRTQLPSPSSGTQSDGSGSVSTISSTQEFREFIYRCPLGHLKQFKKTFTDRPLCAGSTPCTQPSLTGCTRHDPSGHPQCNLPLSCSSLVPYSAPLGVHILSPFLLPGWEGCWKARRTARESCQRRQLIEVL